MKNSTSRKRNKRPEREGIASYKNLDCVCETALYYGFTPTDPPVINKEDVRKAKKLIASERSREGSEPLHFSLEEKIAILRHYVEKNMHNLPQPVMLYFKSPLLPEGTLKKKTGRERHIGLEIIGTGKSIAEAILIKTSVEILKEEGYDGLAVHINSIGEREGMARFVRELIGYYRKNLEELPAHCRQIFKKDVLELLSCQNEKCRIIKENAPKSVSFLSETSRIHFKEVLEFLEILEVPYEIDNFLVDNRLFCTQTIFEIHNKESKTECQPLALGVRYGNLLKKMGLPRDVPSVGVRLAFNQLENDKPTKAVKKPKIFFIQLGFEAKLKSLQVIEILRQAKIPICQSLSRDKFAAQLSLAENMKVPYAIIMGQKEAVENSVIVKNMNTRSQDTVKIPDLPGYLKKL